MQILVLVERRVDRGAVDKELGPVQRLGRRPVVDASEPGDEDVFLKARADDLESAAGPVDERGIAGERQRVIGKGADAHFALDSMGRADDGHQYGVLRIVHCAFPPVGGGLAPAAAHFNSAFTRC